MNDVIINPPVSAQRLFPIRTLRPETPLFGWLHHLDDVLTGEPARFGNRQVVLDLTAAKLHGPGTRALLQELQLRQFRIVGLSGIDPVDLGPEAPRLPPILAAEPVLQGEAMSSPDPVPLVVNRIIRSGQEVANPHGDVTIVGSVGSGAEVVAAGSIHVYGTLQGRAIAGAAGSIFCQKLEAELLRIGTVFIAADDMPAALRGRAARAWRDGDVIRFAAL